MFPILLLPSLFFAKKKTLCLWCL